MSDIPVVGWSDLLCERCQSIALDYGFGQGLAHVLSGNVRECDGCRERLERLQWKHQTNGIAFMRPFCWMPRERERELTALHEAGHAIVGRALGLELSSITVAQPGNVIEGRVLDTAGGELATDGYTAWRPTTTSLHIFGSTNLAGVRAVRRWLSGTEYDSVEARIQAEVGGASDLHGIETAAGGAVPSDVFHAARSEADQVLRRYHVELEELQRAVLRHGYLDHEHAERVIRRARPTPPPRETTTTRTEIPDAQPARQHTTNTTGGTSMGIEAIRQAAGITTETTTEMQGALQHVVQLAEQLMGTLHSAVGESGQPEVQQALGVLQQLATTDIPQMQGALDMVTSAISEYAARL